MKNRSIENQKSLLDELLTEQIDIQQDKEILDIELQQTYNN